MTMTYTTARADIDTIVEGQEAGFRRLPFAVLTHELLNWAESAGLPCPDVLGPNGEEPDGIALEWWGRNGGTVNVLPFVGESGLRFACHDHRSGPGSPVVLTREGAYEWIRERVGT